MKNVFKKFRGDESYFVVKKHQGEFGTELPRIKHKRR